MSEKIGKKIARPNRPLADVNVIPQEEGANEIVVCFMPDPDLIVGEGNSKAYLALDASVSLKAMYGISKMGGAFFGEMTTMNPNYVQAVARKIGTVLTTVTRSGKVSGIYWAVGHSGNKIEEIGSLDEDEWAQVEINGPQKQIWGKGTKILPAIEYAVEELSKEADWTMGVIITDGIIEDEKESMEYCMKVAKDIAEGRKSNLKLVLIGIGEEVDEAQLQRFDDMFEGTELEEKIDLWGHGMVASMQNEADILAVLYGELMDEDIIISPTGRVETKNGDILHSWTDGMPGKFRFILPKGNNEFVIKAGNSQIVQDISEVL